MRSDATVFDIQKFSVIDGPGIRTTVFFKGCNLRCEWCHNPESQHAYREMLFREERCRDCGKCTAVCPSPQGCILCGKCERYCPTQAREIAGREYSIEALFTEILADRLFYETSGGGVTFSGGECMLQIDALSELLRLCRENGIHTAVDTAGCVPWESFQRVLPYTDLFLYDVKCIDEALHIKGTGVSNRLILENLCRLSQETDRRIIVRVPVIGGYNDTDGEIRRIADFLAPLRIESAELLPYHSMGEQKYRALGREAQHFTVPDAERMERFRTMFPG
jgi:pyruvate formate lyase activating enzyme